MPRILPIGSHRLAKMKDITRSSTPGAEAGTSSMNTVIVPSSFTHISIVESTAIECVKSMLTGNCGAINAELPVGDSETPFTVILYGAKGEAERSNVVTHVRVARKLRSPKLFVEIPSTESQESVPFVNCAPSIFSSVCHWSTTSLSRILSHMANDIHDNSSTSILLSSINSEVVRFLNALESYLS